MNENSKDSAAKSDRSILEERPDLAERMADLAAQDASDNLFPKRLKVLRQEQGRSFPSVDRLPRIAAFFDVTVDYLIGANRDTVNRRIVQQLAALSPEQRQAVELVLSSMNNGKKNSSI